LLSHGTDISTAWDDQDFFKYCPPTRCSKDGPEIRFPLRLESSNSSPSCGAATCTKLTCSGEDTILRHPFLGLSKVIDLDYNNSMMKIVPLLEQQFSKCPIQNLTLPADDLDDMCYLNVYEAGRLVECTAEFTPSGILQYGGSFCSSHTNYYKYESAYFVSSGESAADLIAGPIPCLSNPGRFTYLVHACLLMTFLPLDCKVLSNTLVPIFLIASEDEDTHTFKKRAETIIGFSDITTSWSQWYWTTDKKFATRGSITDFCNHCESQGQPCAFSSRRSKPFCMPHSNKGLRHKVIAGAAARKLSFHPKKEEK
ncbi:unnamed protein product, partial [Urochloa humidicola]